MVLTVLLWQSRGCNVYFMVAMTTINAALHKLGSLVGDIFLLSDILFADSSCHPVKNN